ncbi:alpha/beta hydrolase [Lactiplantibacillus sp. WILCCON 0030]|uniref:Alpha/beta hydrolase n=1 Tax=Lactiplantibacillus brownii TaxID=3069269 RepID=A0ABU1A8M3_9LACO|nr:alpha/beta hydrolase [Lactiplantibacillus brownii]MDQ7936798.1 alpha/beta hydrolase [Lactiplantibacillus brownii]
MMPMRNLDTVKINGVNKITKPFNDTVASGQLDPAVLKTMTNLDNPVQLENNLTELRTGSLTPPIKDSVGDRVTVETTLLNCQSRAVPVEWLTPSIILKHQIMVYFHGGAFYGGQASNNTALLKAIADHSHCEIINVDYSLAPEHKAPAGILDGLAVIQYLQQARLDTKIAIAGDSAGANIALAVASLNRQLGSHQINQQLLLYPVTAPGADHQGPLWDVNQYAIIPNQRARFEHYHDLFKQIDTLMTDYYLPANTDTTSPLISPLNQLDLANSPATLIMMGEFDPFRLQAWEYAENLANTGVDTTFVQYQGQNHAFAPLIDRFWQARDVADLMTERLVSLMSD